MTQQVVGGLESRNGSFFSKTKAVPAHSASATAHIAASQSVLWPFKLPSSCRTNVLTAPIFAATSSAVPRRHAASCKQGYGMILVWDDLALLYPPIVLICTITLRLAAEWAVLAQQTQTTREFRLLSYGEHVASRSAESGLHRQQCCQRKSFLSRYLAQHTGGRNQRKCTLL